MSKTSRGRLPVLEDLHKDFCTNLSRRLGGKQVSVKHASPIRYDKMMGSLARGDTVQVLSMRPLVGNALLVVDEKSTSISSDILQEYNTVWSTFEPVRFKRITTESKPATVEIVENPEDVINVTDFTIQDDDTELVFKVALPYVYLRPLEVKLGHTH